MRQWGRDQRAREVVFAGAALLLACDRPASTSSPSPSPPATASVTVAVPEGTASPSASTLPLAPPAPAAPRDPELPPTPAEWTAQGRPVVIEGADGFGCAGAMVDSWLRVRCAGEGAQRAEGVEVTRGGGDGMTFAVTQPKAASLVLPFAEGVDVRATFTFSGREAELRVSWPRGAEAPATKGEMSARE